MSQSNSDDRPHMARNTLLMRQHVPSLSLRMKLAHDIFTCARARARGSLCTLLHKGLGPLGSWTRARTASHTCARASRSRMRCSAKAARSARSRAMFGWKYLRATTRAHLLSYYLILKWSKIMSESLDRCPAQAAPDHAVAHARALAAAAAARGAVVQPAVGLRVRCTPQHTWH